MEIILKKDVQGVGYKNDVVSVKAGFGRNYLIPQGLALVANDSNKKVAAENVKQAAHKAEKLKTEAEALSTKIGAATIQVSAKIGDSGKIFGAVTTLQLADALNDKGIAVDRRQIAIQGSVKEAGDFKAIVDLHKEVKVELSFAVVAAE